MRGLLRLGDESECSSALISLWDSVLAYFLPRRRPNLVTKVCVPGILTWTRVIVSSLKWIG